MTRSLAFLALVALTFVACGPRRQLAGHVWSGSLMNFPTKLDFKSNGASEIRLTSPLGDLTMRGTFSETNDAVTLTIQDIEVPAVANQGAGMMDRLKGAPLTFKLNWVSDSEVSLTPQVPGGIFSDTVMLRREAR